EPGHHTTLIPTLQDIGVPVDQLGHDPRFPELLLGLIVVRLAQDRAIGWILYVLPDPVSLELLKRERQLANVGTDAVQTGIQRRIAQQRALLFLAVLLPCTGERLVN